MKTALLFLLLAAGTMRGRAPAAPPAVQARPMVQALREEEARWQTIEPELFTTEGARKHLGVWVRCSGAPVSLRSPVIIRLASGTIVRLTKLQGADREFLASFHKRPSVVVVRGPILAVDRTARTVTIQAVSTMFEQ